MGSPMSAQVRGSAANSPPLQASRRSLAPPPPSMLRCGKPSDGCASFSFSFAKLEKE